MDLQLDIGFEVGTCQLFFVPHVVWTISSSDQSPLSEMLPAETFLFLMNQILVIDSSYFVFCLYEWLKLLRNEK